MPIVMTAKGPLLFAHVPKCAGTSVEAYLSNAFGPLAFHDPYFNQIPNSLRWSRTSPQHADAATLLRLFPQSFLCATFSVVRHPVSRLASVFRFQRDIENRIPTCMPFEEWLRALTPSRRRSLDFDNHIRTMSDMVPDSSIVFRMENGWAQLIDWLQAFCEAGSVLPRDMPEHNVFERRIAHEGRNAAPVVASPEAVEIISKIYHVDFARFGYSLDNTEKS